MKKTNEIVFPSFFYIYISIFVNMNVKNKIVMKSRIGTKLAVQGLMLAMAFTSPVFAQGLYFDTGIGIGSATTKVDGLDFVTVLKGGGGSVSELAVDVGLLKVGYGPIADKPFYIVGELGGIGHKIEGSLYYIQINSYLFGPGIIYYPIPLIQLGASVGYSWVAYDTDMPITLPESDGGYAWNISAAIDLGGGNHGCLIGLKYFSATNTLKSNEEMNSSMIGVFVKYAYRKKISSLADEEAIAPRKPQNNAQQVVYEPEPVVNNPQKPQSTIRNFAVKNYSEIVKENQNGSGEYLNSLILLMDGENIPKDEALLIIKKALRKADGNADAFGNEIEKSLSE
jgi:hypothetical protein